MTDVILASPTHVVALVDWNSQLLISTPTGRDHLGAAKTCLERTANDISRCLARIDPNRRFRVDLRLYHGWHKGYEPTANLKAVRIAVAEVDFGALSVKANVVFNESVGYGDELLGALQSRIHPSLGVHLPNTLRVQRKGEPAQEKMVDTAIAADMLYLAVTNPADWIMVVAEDDDLVPPAFVSEAWVERKGGRVALMRKRKSSGNFLLLDGILFQRTSAWTS